MTIVYHDTTDLSEVFIQPSCSISQRRVLDCNESRVSYDSWSSLGVVGPPGEVDLDEPQLTADDDADGWELRKEAVTQPKNHLRAIQTVADISVFRSNVTSHRC
jgi:hypothetical protein